MSLGRVVEVFLWILLYFGRFAARSTWEDSKYGFISEIRGCHCLAKGQGNDKISLRGNARGDFSKDYDLRSQIRRACASIMANIAEGFGRHSDKEFANLLNIAHASAYEVQSLLRRVRSALHKGKDVRPTL